MSFSVTFRCFSHQIAHRNYFHMPLTLLCKLCRQGVSSYEKVRLHKGPDNALHSVDDCVLCSVIHPQGYVCYQRTVLNESDDFGIFFFGGQRRCTMVDWLIPF